jgi:hypothetical protein
LITVTDEPTAPLTETPADTEEKPPEESDAPAKPQRRSLMQTLFGWADGTENATEGDGEDEAEEGGDDTIARPIELQLPPSPISGQSKSPRGQPDYTPVKIVFLTGDYKGQQVDLGLGINELSGGQSANWEELAQSNIRQGLTFKNLTPRNISFDVTFWSGDHDVSHLVENLKHLQEITSVRSTAAGGLPYPPLLLLTIGSQRFSVVCTEISDKYEHPHPENVGFRFCTCSLTFKQISDKTTPDSLGRPSTGTPLLAWISNTTDQERKKQAQQAIVEESLFNGVSSEQSEEVRKLVEDNALNDKTRILDLDPKSFVNLALAGGFSKALLADPEVQAKLKEDLATLFAENADGILSEDPRYFRLLTEALQSGDPSNLPEVLREQFDDYKKDYNIIYEAIEKQALDSTSNHGLFTKPEFLEARKKLFAFGGRGLELRQAQVFNDNIEDAQTSKAVEDINKFLAEKSDDEIKEAFGLQRPGQVRIIKNRYPYSSKQHFLNELRELESDGFSSSGAWSKFVETQAPPPEGG